MSRDRSCRSQNCMQGKHQILVFSVKSIDQDLNAVPPRYGGGMVSDHFWYAWELQFAETYLPYEIVYPMLAMRVSFSAGCSCFSMYRARSD